MLTSVTVRASPEASKRFRWIALFRLFGGALGREKEQKLDLTLI